MWLNEGLAIYTSGQLKFKDRPNKLQNFLEYYNGSDQNVYSESGFAVKTLVDKFGSQKMAKLVKDIKNIPKAKESFDKIFKDIYGLEPSYENFNSIFEK